MPCASSSAPLYFTPVTETRRPWRFSFLLKYLNLNQALEIQFLFFFLLHQINLQELLELKEIVPKESPVYFLIGKVPFQKIRKYPCSEKLM